MSVKQRSNSLCLNLKHILSLLDAFLFIPHVPNNILYCYFKHVWSEMIMIISSYFIICWKLFHFHLFKSFLRNSVNKGKDFLNKTAFHAATVGLNLLDYEKWNATHSKWSEILLWILTSQSANKVGFNLKFNFYPTISCTAPSLATKVLLVCTGWAQDPL